jgi:peptide/nickel transport system substrate-binding protein
MKFGAPMTRRSALKLAVAAAAAPLSACAGGQSSRVPSSKPSSSVLRLGIGGAATSDSLDSATYMDTFCINVGRQIMNGLVAYDAQGRVAPELLESWEVEPGAVTWTFQVRDGVEFHNGKTLSVGDLAYSINRHRGANSKSAAAGPLRIIKDVRVTGAKRLTVELHGGDADLLHVLADFPLLVVPDGFNDWDRPVGTGPFRFESFTPGVKAITVRQPNYWKANGPRVESVESIAINDDAARIGALLNGDVDVVNRVLSRQAGQIEASPGVGIRRTPGRYHVEMAMQVDADPFTSVDVRRALKFGIDRQAALDSLFGGFGSLGNDHPIAPSDPDFNSELAQTAYDPEMARHHLKKAGLDRLEVKLHTSDAAFLGANDLAHSFASSARDAGIEIDVAVESADGFWDRVWMKTPFFVGFWNGLPGARMFEIAYRSIAPWNETKWRNPAFDALIASAKTELDERKRRQHLWELQAILHEDGGAIIPAFKDWVDAASDRVQGYTMGGPFDLCDGRIAERVWLSS